MRSCTRRMVAWSVPLPQNMRRSWKRRCCGKLRNEVVVINAEGKKLETDLDVLGYEKRDCLFRSLFSAHFRGPDYRGE